MGGPTPACEPARPAVRAVFGGDPTMVQSNLSLHYRGISAAALGEYSRGHRGHLSQDHVLDRRCPHIVDDGTWPFQSRRVAVVNGEVVRRSFVGSAKRYGWVRKGRNLQSADSEKVDLSPRRLPGIRMRAMR